MVTAAGDILPFDKQTYGSLLSHLYGYKKVSFR